MYSQPECTMPVSIPSAKTPASNPSFCFKAAFAAAVTIAALIAGLAMAALYYEERASWRHALPVPGMSAEETETAHERARALHTAQVGPLLRSAGFADIADAAARPFGGYSRNSAPASVIDALTEALWSTRAFPELHDAFLERLCDAYRPALERVREFYMSAVLLADVAEVLVQGTAPYDMRLPSGNFLYEDFIHDANIPAWFAYFADDPRLPRIEDRERYRRQRYQAADKERDAAAYTENMALARRVLPLMQQALFREIQDMADRARAEAASAAAVPGKDTAAPTFPPKDPYSRRALDSLRDALHTATKALRKNSGVDAFLPQAERVLGAREGTLPERCAAVPLIAKRPGLPASEYLFWQAHKENLDSIAWCVGTNPLSHAYIIGCCDEFGRITKKMLTDRGSFILGGHEGPGMVLTRVEAFRPEHAPTGSLYLLADMRQAFATAPPHDLALARPVFAGTLFRHLENQPLVLPLNPKNATDKALLDWYAEKGWLEGHTLLFSAVGEPANIARHWASVLLLWWDADKDTPDAEPDLAYLHPVGGPFMLGLTSALKGPEVSRFFGPITALWFGRRSVDAHGWTQERYEARPQNAPLFAAQTRPLRSPLLAWLSGKEARAEKPVYTQAEASIVFGKEAFRHTEATFAHNYRIVVAQGLQSQYPDASVSPRETYDFVDTAVRTLKEWNITDKNLALGLDCLWRFKNSPEGMQRIREVLSDTQEPQYKRMRTLRRVLGIPAYEGRNAAQ